MTDIIAFHVSQDYTILEPKSGAAFPIPCDEWERLKARLKKISTPPWIYEACASILAGISLTTLVNILTDMLPSPLEHPKASVIAWAICVSAGALALVSGVFAFERRRMKSVYIDDVIADMENLERRFDRDATEIQVGDLVILEATYGARDHRINVTQKLNTAVIDGKLHTYVGNQLGGDPCPNTAKQLAVRYKYKDKEYEKVVAEGTDINLP